MSKRYFPEDLTITSKEVIVASLQEYARKEHVVEYSFYDICGMRFEPYDIAWYIDEDDEDTEDVSALVYESESHGLVVTLVKEGLADMNVEVEFPFLVSIQNTDKTFLFFNEFVTDEEHMATIIGNKLNRRCIEYGKDNVDGQRYFWYARAIEKPLSYEYNVFMHDKTGATTKL